MREEPKTPEEFMRRYSRVTAMVSATLLAPLFTAAEIGLDAINDRQNPHDFIRDACDGSAREGLAWIIENRHRQFKGEYDGALEMIPRALALGRDYPLHPCPRCNNPKMTPLVSFHYKKASYRCWECGTWEDAEWFGGGDDV